MRGGEVRLEAGGQKVGGEGSAVRSDAVRGGLEEGLHDVRSEAREAAEKTERDRDGVAFGIKSGARSFGRVEDKGGGGHAVVREDGGVGGNGWFENLGKDAGVMQRAAFARAEVHDADEALQAVAEGAAPGGAGEAGKAGGCGGVEDDGGGHGRADRGSGVAGFAGGARDRGDGLGVGRHEASLGEGREQWEGATRLWGSFGRTRADGNERIILEIRCFSNMFDGNGEHPRTAGLAGRGRR